MFSVHIDEESMSVLFKIRRMNHMTKAGVRKAFSKISYDLKAESARLILNTNKNGRFYNINVGGVRRLHRASAPGESPAEITGKLRKSVNTSMGGSFSMNFGSNTSYGGYLERGTSRIEPRPYLIRSIKNERRNMVNHFRLSINEQLNK